MSVSLRGKTVAFSGSFSNLGFGKLSGKLEAMAKAKSLGATVQNHIHRGTQILVTGDGNVGVKKQMALYHGAKVLPANSFLKFVAAGGAKKVAAAASAPGRVRAVATSRGLVATAAAATHKTSSPTAEEKDFISQFNKKMALTKATRARAIKAALKAKLVQAKLAAKGRARTLALSRQMKAKTASATPVASSKKSATVAAVAAAASEEEDFGPMPWMKGSRFNSKAEKASKLKRSRALKAKLAASAPVAAEVEAVKPAAVVAPVDTTPVETVAASAPPVTEAVPSITFAPSKGLTIQFQGDFADFCRAANQVVLAKDSASATTVTEKI